MDNYSLFQSKYDNEFIGLLNEIGIRLQKFDKCDTLKIKSWINILMMPCKSNIDKKNRNLYAILLINQMVNGKLEEPFVKFANSTFALLIDMHHIISDGTSLSILINLLFILFGIL